MSLEAYLKEKLPARLEEIKNVTDVTTEVVSVYPNTFHTELHVWPYQIEENTSQETWIPPGQTQYSFSTAAMVLFAHQTLLGHLQESKSAEGVISTPRLRKVNLADFTSSVNEKDIRRNLEENASKAKAVLKEKLTHSALTGKLTESGTFGDNDPLTLGWVCELFSKEELEDIPNCREIVLSQIKLCFDHPANFSVGQDSQTIGHAFPILRCVHLYLRAKQYWATDDLNVTRVRDWFEQRLHAHLSYAHLPNASFDAPELIFCIEGLLACSPTAFGMKETLDQAFKVIEQKQEYNPNLRPYRPMLSNSKGFSLLPLTIEVFNSLLRILENLDGHEVYKTLVARARPIIERYVDWLFSQRRIITLADAKTKLVGWASEHTHTSRLIHVWETSQVVLFLTHYVAWLRCDLQRELIEAGNFKVEMPKCERFMPKTEADCSDCEPSQADPIYTPIWRKFIAPRQSESRRTRNHSLLLYGPPGTGKTTFVKFIAAKLKFPLISFAPSDFVAGGADRVEVRAKAIFDALSELNNVVVLFDEIDRLLLDRDSTDYVKQSDIFQFMTPSMLPKIGNLRKRENCIFVIATNYEERIDPAIKRKGRIDIALPVMPPDRKARARFFQEKAEEMNISKDTIESHAIVASTALLTFEELGQLRETLLEMDANGIEMLDRGDVMIKNIIRSGGNTIRLQSYIARLGLRETVDGLQRAERNFHPPVKEFLQVCRIAQGSPSDAPELIGRVKEAFAETEYNVQFLAEAEGVP